MKKLIVLFLLVISLFSCGNKKDSTLFLGYNLNGYISYLKENDNHINDSFVMQKGYISYLYSLVIKDGLDVINNKKISTAIKEANKIYIQIGNDDFLRCVEIYENEYLIDEEVLNTQKELFSYYYFLLIEKVREIFDGEIVILSPYFSLSNALDNMYKIDISLNEFFEVVNEVCSYFDCIYIDIREINNLIKENSMLSEEFYSYLDKLIRYGK